MENVELIVFKVWLLLKISWSISRMVFLLVCGLVFAFSPILAVVIWGIILVLVWKNFAPKQILFGNEKVIVPESQVNKNLDQQIQFWEAARAKQPTDRDILLNLSHLYAAENNQELASKYSQQARELDPNFQP